MDKFIKRISSVILFVLLLSQLYLTTGCQPEATLNIISGSENKTLEPIIEDFERKYNIEVEISYKGSVDMMMEMQTDAIHAYDAVWPANSLWISLGDTNHQIKHVESIMTSPIVIGVRKSLAEELGLVDVQFSISDLLELIRNDDLSFMMTSATQSNSGSCAYIGFLNALLGNPDTIQVEDLHDDVLMGEVTEILSGINRSSGSSGWLKELFLQGDYDAMVNYEALIIEANQELVEAGREPLYALYPYDGLAIADSPLGYVDQGNEVKEEAFLLLQEYLLSEDVQEEILSLGRRTGFGGTVSNADDEIFNPDWGIDASKTISGIRMPSADVIFEALTLYQTELKKPSFTVYCLDYSGSMRGDGEDQLKAAMEMILDQDVASQYMLQSTNRDITIVVPFNEQILDAWMLEGNDSDGFDELIQKIQELDTGGGTDIYGPSMYALELIRQIDIDDYIPAVVLMTDGLSNDGYDYRDLRSYYIDLDMDVPIFSIMFGAASEDQLEEIAELSLSRVFDGKEDLISAFKKARGYN